MRTAEQAMSDYQFFKSHGICPQCGKEKAAPGRVCCLNCLDKQNIRKLERWDSMTEEQKEQVRSRVRQSGKTLYKQRKAAGLCVRCGKPAQQGHVRCSECNIKHRNSARRDRNRKLNMPKHPESAAGAAVRSSPASSYVRHTTTDRWKS